MSPTPMPRPSRERPLSSDQSDGYDDQNAPLSRIVRMTVPRDAPPPLRLSTPSLLRPSFLTKTISSHRKPPTKTGVSHLLSCSAQLFLPSRWSTGRGSWKTSAHNYYRLSIGCQLSPRDSHIVPGHDGTDHEQSISDFGIRSPHVGHPRLIYPRSASGFHVP